MLAVETGNFSKAAEALSITQSAVSQRIKFLEEHYGHQLLDRSGPMLKLTEIGRLVLEKTRILLQVENELCEEIDRFGQEKNISVCCTPNFGIARLPAILNTFMGQNADAANLKFLFYPPLQALKGLRDREFDLTVIEHLNDLDLTDFYTYELPKDEMVFISSPQLGLFSSQLDLDDLLPYRLFARKDGCSCKELLSLNLSAHGKNLGKFKGVAISDHLNLIIQSVLSGAGIAFVSKSLVSDYLNSGKLRAHYVEGFNHLRFCTVVLPNKKENSDEVNPLVQTFLDCIFSTLTSPLTIK
jgi:DNA-binding transcriptional LysR family regulator